MKPSDETLTKYTRGELSLTERLLVETHLALSAEDDPPPSDSTDLPELTPYLEPPPQQQLDDIWRRLGALRNLMSSAPLPKPVAAELAPKRWRWHVFPPGRGAYSEVAEDSEAILYCVLLGPGTRFPAHRHRGQEQVVVCAGVYSSGGKCLTRGDWDEMDEGSDHAPQNTSSDDCWFLVRVARPGLRFRGMGLLRILWGRLLGKRQPFDNP